MVLAFTGAGISKPSGIPTFKENPQMRKFLSREYANQHPEEYNKIIADMWAICKRAEPNDAHRALAEYNIPIITMNVDRLHQRAGSQNVLAIHGELPNIALYGDPAPGYTEARNWVGQLLPDDVFIIIGTSFYTDISKELFDLAQRQGAQVAYIDSDAEVRVRWLLKNLTNSMGDFEEFLQREIEE